MQASCEQPDRSATDQLSTAWEACLVRPGEGREDGQGAQRAHAPLLHGLLPFKPALLRHEAIRAGADIQQHVGRASLIDAGVRW